MQLGVYGVIVAGLPCIGVNSYWAAGPEPNTFLDHGAHLSLSPPLFAQLFSVRFSIGLILADLHILYATKQNKKHYHQAHFLGLN